MNLRQRLRLGLPVGCYAMSDNYAKILDPTEQLFKLLNQTINDSMQNEDTIKQVEEFSVKETITTPSVQNMPIKTEIEQAQE